MRMKGLLLCAGLLAAAGCRKSGPPFSPREELGTFKIEPGYRIELFASEPDVVSPVAMEFDEDGRIYVVEDRGYPINVKGKVGRIKLLQDTNGDGIPDKTTIFADHLVLPTGVMRWKKGILVTDAPDVWYLEDTDGDGKADIRRPVLTGFPFTNPQHTVNAPLYGLDNWIYLAHENAVTAIVFKDLFGDRGSDIRYTDGAGPVLKQRGRSIRFRPDTHELEALSASSQFGQVFDDWGRRFTVSNSNHIRLETIAARYLERNPDLPVASAVEDISDHGAAAKVYPITTHPRFEMLSGVGQFTSACGNALWNGSYLVAEPVHGLVHRDVLQAAGSSFKATRARDGVEFMASTDSWFRPVNLVPGPDGALYLLDYYRLVIEHPEWMSTHTHHSHELTAGSDRGRIWRIVPPGGAGRLKGIALGRAADAELVRQLANPIPWWRRTAQRLLVQRKAVAAAPELVRMARESASPQGRLHALWTLEGLGKLEEGAIQAALRDAEPGVRENAIVLAESRLARSPALVAALLGMARDGDVRVQYQLLATLGFINSPQARAVRDELLFRNVQDKWFQVAALSAGSADAPRLFERAVREPAGEGPETLARYSCAVIGAGGNGAEVERVLKQIAAAGGDASQWWRTAGLEGLNMGLRRNQAAFPRAGRELLLRMFADRHAPVRRAALHTLELTGIPAGGAPTLKHARVTATDSKADPDLRADALDLLALADPQPNAALFRELVDPHQPEAVQEAAVRGYGKIGGDEPAAFLLKNWRTLTARVRAAAGDAMYGDPARVRMLLSAMQAGDIQGWTLTSRQRLRLLMYQDPAIREQARKLLDQTPADREAVVKRYQPALDRRGDAARGREVFRNICAKCHRLEGHGAEVGPDLATVQNQPKQVLLTNILIPSQSIAQGYESYVVETAGGATLDGVIGPQTPTTITLRHEDGKEDVIPRRDIKNMYVTNLSAMPADLEKQIDIERMTDLLEYLKTAGH